MTQDEQKRRAALAALDVVEPLLAPGSLVGVGTGSTANHFIDGLVRLRGNFAAAVPSSAATAARLRERGVAVADLREVDAVAVYVDGADEVAPDRALIKGGGGALTREKIVAACAAHFVCIVDESKLVAALGAFPLPVEALPEAQALVARRLRERGGLPALRDGFETDNGNVIFDVRGLSMRDPQALEAELNGIPGVVENGLFTGQRRPHAVLAGTAAPAANGVRRIVGDGCPDMLRTALAQRA